MRTLGLVFLVAVYGALDVSAIHVWRSDLTLWRHVLTVSPAHVRAQNNYAKARVAAGDRAWLP